MKCSTGCLGALALLSIVGCSTSHSVKSAAAPAVATATPIDADTGPCVGTQCAAEIMREARGTEVAVDKDVPSMAGQPLTSVVVTQCNLIVAVYMTMPDGRLLRFDNKAAVPAEQLIKLAYTAPRSERVEVSCDEDAGESAGVAVGFERHEPI
jgi:hypothetical protein